MCEVYGEQEVVGLVVLRDTQVGHTITLCPGTCHMCFDIHLDITAMSPTCTNPRRKV